MKKILIMFFTLFLIAIVVFFGLKTHAEEIQNNQPLIEEQENEDEKKTNEIEEEKKEEEISFSDQLKDWCDNWLGIIISCIAGSASSVSIVLFALRIIKGLRKSVETSTMLSSDERDRVTKKLDDAQKALENANESLKETTDSYKEIADKAEERMNKMEDNAKIILEKFDIQQEQLEKFKELIALLVVANPSLMSDGTATKILTLLGEGVEQDEKKEV